MRNWTCSRLAWIAGASLSLLTFHTAAAAAAAAAASLPERATPCAPERPQACAAAPEAAPVTPAGRIDPDSLLLFAVELDKITITEGLAAYGEPSDPLIPVGEFSRLLEYDVDVLPSERRIVGRLGEARTSMIVDLATGTARIGSKTVSLAPADVAVTNNEIYLKASALSRLLPLKLKADPEALNLVIEPSELIPIQSRMQRLSRLRDNRSPLESREQLLSVPSPYRLISPPGFDVAINVGAASQGSTDGPPYTTRYDIRAGGDLLYGNYQAYLGSDENGKASTARFTIGRESVEGRLLGPLHARKFSLGDVYTPGLAIGPRSLNGRGFSLSTVPVDQSNIFNRVDLRGELPLGYDVELYVNDVLQGGQNTPNKGRYEFLNVPLARGVNVVRIVTYGPHGERNEDTRIVNVGGAQLARGETTLELGVVQQEDTIFTFERPRETTDFISSAEGRLRAVAAVNYGLTQFVTLSGGAAVIPVPGANSLGQFSLGARTSLFGFLTQVDVGYDTRGGSAEGLGLAGQLFGVSTVLRYLQFQNGFVDENGPGADFTRPLASRGEISFDGNLNLKSALIPLSFRASRTVYEDGATNLTGAVRASGSMLGVLVSSGLEYTRDYGVRLPTTERLTGFFAASTFRSFKWQIRSTIDYDILPELQARALAITVDHDLSDHTSLRFGIGENLNNFESFNLTASALTRTRYGDLALTADYNNGDSSWRLGAGLNFGLAYDPLKRRYGVMREGAGSGGSVAFHAFVDGNGNGHFDPGEKGVANVAVEGGGNTILTDGQGRALITGLGAGGTGRLTVSLDNLDNPSVKSPPLNLKFSPRPGEVTVVDFPMQPTGEVMVRILLRRPDGSRVGLSAVHAQLVGPGGQIIEAVTEFDGTASFDGLTPGAYALALDPEQAKRLRMHLVAPLSVTIKADGSFNKDATAEVAFDPRPDAAASAAPGVE